MNRKKRIAFILHSLETGGVERALVTMLNRFDYTRYDVTLWMYRVDGAFVPQLNPRVRICRIECPSPEGVLKDYLKRGHLVRVAQSFINRLLARIHLNNNILNLRYCTKCLPFCTAERYDCVIAYQGLARDQVATALYRFRAKKRIFFVHGKNAFADAIKPNIQKEYIKFDQICAVSASTRDEFLEDFPLLCKKCVVIHNIFDSEMVIDLAKEPIGKILQRPALVTVGRLSFEKGQNMIPASTRILLDSGCRVYWYLIGEGDLRPKLESEISRLAVGNHVFLLGGRQNPYPYIKEADIYIQTSYSEGWGLTVQEAKALQTPIVVTPVGALQEQISDGVNGMVADAVTPESLAQSVRVLLQRPDLRKKFASALEKRDFDNERELQLLYDCIEK